MSDPDFISMIIAEIQCQLDQAPLHCFLWVTGGDPLTEVETQLKKK